MWVVSFYTQLSLQHDGLVQHLYHFSCSTNPSLNILLPSPVTCEQDLKIRKILQLGQDLIHDPEWALQTFPTEEHGGNLEMLILIPTAHTRPRPVIGKLEAISHQESDLLPPTFHMPQLWVEDLVDWSLCQAFAAHLHCTFRCAWSVRVIRLTTRWWSADISAQLFTRVSRTYGYRSSDTFTKSIIDPWPRASWCHVHLWKPLCSNMVLVMDKMGFAHKSEK